MRYCFLLVVVLSLAITAWPQLKVSQDKKHLVYKNNGNPFFWLGDTAWELFHRLSKEEARQYLENRAAKGFTVIQAVVLAEQDGLRQPNYYGDLPLKNEDPARPNEAYFRHVDEVVKLANRLGLIIAMLPSWGDKWNKKWGTGPEVFTPAKAKIFGEYLGKRYKDAALVWVLGGDRNCDEPEDYSIIRSMAEGLKKGDGGKHLMTFHPQGGKSSSDFFREDDWIDFHMSQTGHDSDSKNYLFNQKHLAMVPLKPHLDGEPRYEDHPNRFDPVKYGWMDDFDARQCAYWSMLSGALGHTYGNHNIWQFYTEERYPVSFARTHWKVALDHEGARQMGIMRRFFEYYEWQKLEPDNSLIEGANPPGPAFKIAAIANDSSFMMVYIPFGDETIIHTGKMKGKKLSTYFFNPRDGEKLFVNLNDSDNRHVIKPHSSGRGSDWIFVIETGSSNRN